MNEESVPSALSSQFVDAERKIKLDRLGVGSSARLRPQREIQDGVDEATDDVADPG
jgi:hypothetical protein